MSVYPGERRFALPRTWQFSALGGRPADQSGTLKVIAGQRLRERFFTFGQDDKVGRHAHTETLVVLANSCSYRGRAAEMKRGFRSAGTLVCVAVFGQPRRAGLARSGL